MAKQQRTWVVEGDVGGSWWAMSGCIFDNKQVEWVRVQQEDANGCVVATLAMLTGDSYAQVKSAFVGHDFSKTGCCSEFEGCNYLRERGFAYQKMYRHNGLTKTDREDWPILWVKSRLLVGYMAQVELGGNVHAVAVKPNGTVLDPWRDGEYRLADYAKCNHLIAVFDIQACSRPADVEAAYSSSRDAEIKSLVAELVGALDWKPIKDAPKNGEHILVANFLVPGGWGPCRVDGGRQSSFAVVHWWDSPGEEGWCLSIGGGDYFSNPTHFKYLRELGEETARAKETM